jgi:hypothetical protein
MPAAGEGKQMVKINASDNVSRIGYWVSKDNNQWNSCPSLSLKQKLVSLRL